MAYSERQFWTDLAYVIANRKFWLADYGIEYQR